MLRLTQLRVRIGGADVLRHVSMHVPPNSFVGLVGPNGAGKTTLMRAVMNLVPAWSGEIYIAGERTTQAPPYAHARHGVGYMPEDRRLVGDWTVEQNILLPALATRARDPRQRLNKIYTLMPEVTEFAARRTMQLSGGQQKLVALARALMAATRLLILDEPFEGVAPALAQRLAEILSQLRRENTLSILISESDAVHSRALVDDIYTIERGRIEARTPAPLLATAECTAS
jgi:branched-chain amino acid transport system ATP-binding protein